MTEAMIHHCLGQHDSLSIQGKPVVGSRAVSTYVSSCASAQSKRIPVHDFAGGATSQNNVEGIKTLESLAQKVAGCHIRVCVLNGMYVVLKPVTHESANEGFT